MISVKGAKVDPKVTDAAEIYSLREDQRQSRTPFLAGGLAVAVGAFLKTSLETAARAETGSAGPRRAEPAEGQPAATDQVGLPVDALSEVARQAEARPETSEAFRFSTQIPDTFESNFVRPTAPPSKGSPLAGPRSAQLPQEEAPHSEVAESSVSVGPQAKGDGAANSSATIPNSAPESHRTVFLDNVSSGGTLAISFRDLLAHVSDADGDRLSVQEASVSSGSLVRTSTGYLFRADDDALGPVQIILRVSDGNAGIEVVAQLSTVPNSFVGTAANDEMAGSLWRDEIIGDLGDDEIRGLGGSDFLDGGAGNDTIFGGAGHDAIDGSGGDDLLQGGEGNDAVSGGEGNDWLFGEYGVDILFGDAGADVLADGFGADILFGGQGADTIIAALDAEADLYDGGEDLDTLDYSAADAALRIDLVAGIAEGEETGRDVITGFEIVRAGAGDDYFVVGINGVTLAGGEGANVFEFAEVTPGQVTSESLYNIIDFNVGDVIRSTRYDIFSRSDDDDDDDDLYQAMQADEGTPNEAGRIRYHHEFYSDDQERTIVEWGNDDFSHLTLVTLNGHQVLVWTENGA
mgnify:CR=1 FL=1